MFTAGAARRRQSVSLSDLSWEAAGRRLGLGDALSIACPQKPRSIGFEVIYAFEELGKFPNTKSVNNKDGVGVKKSLPAGAARDRAERLGQRQERKLFLLDDIPIFEFCSMYVTEFCRCV